MVGASCNSWKGVTHWVGDRAEPLLLWWQLVVSVNIEFVEDETVVEKFVGDEETHDDHA